MELYRAKQSLAIECHTIQVKRGVNRRFKAQRATMRDVYSCDQEMPGVRRRQAK